LKFCNDDDEISTSFVLIGPLQSAVFVTLTVEVVACGAKQKVLARSLTAEQAGA